MKKFLHLTIVTCSVALGVLIVLYYWKVQNVTGLQKPPLNVMVMTMIYIVLQILKRYFISGQNWWDWMYYVGLFSMMIALFFSQEASFNLFSWITKIGSIFFLIPIPFDLNLIFSKSEK